MTEELVKEVIIPVVGRVEAKLDKVLEQQSTHEARIRTLENKLTWKNVVVSALVACATAVTTLLASGCGAPPAVEHPTRPELDRANRATVLIRATGYEGDWTGTGWYEAADKIMTAGHVCTDDPSELYTVTMYDGDVAAAYPLMDSDTEPFDLCTMQVVAYESPVWLEKADEPPALWDHVYYAGYPQGMLSTQEGTVVGFHEGFIRAAIAAYPGASGSALLNDKGEVVGVLSNFYPYDFNNFQFAPVTI